MTLQINDIDGPFVILDDSRIDVAGSSYIFHSPSSVICAQTLDEVPAALEQLDDAVAKGYFAAGWLAYEVAAAFENRVAAIIHEYADEPLIWLMVTRHREVFTKPELDAMIETCAPNAPDPNYHFRFEDDEALDEADYQLAFNKIADYIDAGDVYQVNYTYPRPIRVRGSALALYAALRKEQPVAYGAYINTGGHQILSLSPELFFKRTANVIESHPMKGTARRLFETDAVSRAANQEARAALAVDTKNRAENLMIVDLIRNDLSRIAKPGSVKVDDLYGIEDYPTVYQMTSKVRAECETSLTPSLALGALFPCGSVTGAPKIRAMEIIEELESSPRGVYCGALGFFGPAEGVSNAAEPDWVLNVPIRTLVIGEDGQGRMSVGSGIVKDSGAGAEFDECEAKLAFAKTQAASDVFYLIETMRIENGSVPFLDAHLDRLERSAAYFGFDFSLANIERELNVACAENSDGIYRARMGVYKNGRIEIACVPFDSSTVGDDLTVAIAKENVLASDIYRQHKTSCRSLYDTAFATAQASGLADIIFLNEFGRVAEGAISNVFIREGGTLYTPPINDGALPGVLRASLIANRDFDVVERQLTLQDLKEAEHLYIGNALRGLRQVRLQNRAISIHQ